MSGTRIVVTYNCNIMCSHCIYKCGPHRRGTMDTDNFFKAAADAGSNCHNEYISIAGGEPFLHSGIIYKYLKSVNLINLKKNIITNGYWGNIEPFMEILLDFKEIGLDGIIIEYDYFHSIFINTDTVKNAIDKSLKAGLSVMLKSCFVTNNISDKRDVRTFEYIREIKNKFGNINLMFEVLSKGSEKNLYQFDEEKIVLYK
jgi:MoaA/NifB/PqqE/SkfB family radical SAM enzyme